MAEGAFASHGGDSRAAGMVSSDDPYRDLELYLEKVAAELEIGEAVDTATAVQAAPPRRGRRAARRYEEPGQDDDVLADFHELILQELAALGAEQQDAPDAAGSVATANVLAGDEAVSDGKMPQALHNLLLNLRPTSTEPSNTLRIVEDGNGNSADVATQTSPFLSRSSSLVSDSLSLPLAYTPGSDDDRSSSSYSSSGFGCVRRAASTDECLSSVDSHSPTPPESPGPQGPRGRWGPAEEGHESGIGTASPPPSHAGRSPRCSAEATSQARRWDSATSPTSAYDAWVRCESVETQTTCPAKTLVETLVEDVGDDSDNQSADSPTSAEECAGSNLSVTSLPAQRLQLPKVPLTVEDGFSLSAELGLKSSSAPMLGMPAEAEGRGAGRSGEDRRITHKPRSHSKLHLAEIEAAEACKWLRAAGFPQYAQMYEDLQFPVDVAAVAKDHPFLDQDSLQSLFRRLYALNRCANIKVDNLHAQDDDSDEDAQCALSENWTFELDSRRWSRVERDVDHRRADGAPKGANTLEPLVVEGDVVISAVRFGSLPLAGMANLGLPSEHDLAVRFRRSGSERLRDGAKALLRRMESLKTRHRKHREHREAVVIGSPQLLDVEAMQQRMRNLDCVDVRVAHSQGSESESLHLDTTGTSSDSECPPASWRQYRRKDTTNVLDKQEPVTPKRNSLRDKTESHQSPITIPSKSLDVRASTYDNVPAAQSSPRLSQDSSPTPDRLPQDIWIACRELSASHDSNSTLASQPGSEHDDSEGKAKHRGNVVRWHSFQRGSTGRPDSLGPISPSPGRVSVSGLSCGQLLVLRKLALLRLTACMERYCPTHRTGWNWELPKFIRKIKAPDYKDKTAFGVPLLLSLQRCGQALPPAIQKALRWLRANALDQVGLFRKSGVRSRIQRLKIAVETQGDAVSFDGQQAYDVADMVKQFFRELPEALLTNKLSETFISIFQYVPQNQRAEAVSYVLLLLPDEHREALRGLLEFLSTVTMRADVNQMSASNLAVCLAPSLLRLHHHSPTSSSPSSPAGRSTSASPMRRNKSIGAPDPRELSENRAAHDCVLHLIRCHRDLFSVSEETLAQCRFTYMEESVPVALEELGSELSQDWRGYMYACVNALLREARDRSRGWVSVNGGPETAVDVAYRKVGDGHPLRLWRVATEVEAPPGELLQRVLRGRHSWDHSLLKWRIVAKLSDQAEVFQYVCVDMPPLPNRDYCVVRSWRSDLPKGACVVVETSVEHANAPLLPGGVRGIVLASRYLIEPCGSGRSRIMHLSRVDTKGRTPEWYNKSYGHLCAQHLARIRASFRHNAEGPESKV